MKLFFVSLLLIASIACNSNKIPNNGLLSTAKNIKPSLSITFDSSINKLVTNYFHLKDNFITENDKLINFYASEIQKNADSLNFAECKADSITTELAKINAESISAEMQALLEEPNINSKRKSLYLVSEEVFDLLKVMQYDNQNVYKLYCPDALDGSGANWLSKSTDIRNPYLPKTMLTNGKVIDTLHF